MHTLFRHILLSQHYCQLFCTVVTIVEEDNYITFFNSSIEVTIYNRLDEFIRYTFVIRLLHSLNHISGNFTFTVYQQIISYLHTFPTFITVHCIETAYNRSNLTCRLFTMCSQLLNKALAALRVSITAIHEAVNESIVNTIFFCNIAKFE